jgi:hypothetical protein
MAGALAALAPYVPAFVLENPMLILALLYVLYKIYKCVAAAVAAVAASALPLRSSVQWQ